MFEKLKTWYKKKFATKEQLQRYVDLGKLTQEELELITNEK